jgi:serine/threonine protein kinase
MIGSDGEIRICDFGISEKIDKKNPVLTERIGTMTYMAPEVLKGWYGQEADIWSLGCLLYFLITHTDAFDCRGLGFLMKAIKSGNYVPLTDKVSDKIKDLIANMLKVDPKERFSLD